MVRFLILTFIPSGIPPACRSTPAPRGRIPSIADLRSVRCRLRHLPRPPQPLRLPPLPPHLPKVSSWVAQKPITATRPTQPPSPPKVPRLSQAGPSPPQPGSRKDGHFHPASATRFSGKEVLQPTIKSPANKPLPPPMRLLRRCPAPTHPACPRRAPKNPNLTLSQASSPVSTNASANRCTPCHKAP